MCYLSSTAGASTRLAESSDAAYSLGALYYVVSLIFLKIAVSRQRNLS